MSLLHQSSHAVCVTTRPLHFRSHDGAVPLIMWHLTENASALLSLSLSLSHSLAVTLRKETLRSAPSALYSCATALTSAASTATEPTSIVRLPSSSDLTT